MASVIMNGFKTMIRSPMEQAQMLGIVPSNSTGNTARRFEKKRKGLAGTLGSSGIGDYMSDMSEIINLRRARKAKARTEADAEASANRIAHGRSKAEKTTTKAENDAAKRTLDAHKRESHD